MNINPTRNQILVEPIKHGTEAVRGIHIPEAHRETHGSMDCIVLAKGPKSKTDLKIGDRVIVDRYSGIDVKHRGRDYKLVPDKEILAIIE